MPSPPVQKVSFGSCQERKLFPLHFAPDRLGVQMSRQDAPHIGPGCYDNHELGTITYVLQKTPGSQRGYCARTAVRFPAIGEAVTPSPQQYQKDHSLSRIPPSSKTPFNSTTQRFKSPAEDSPGPGTYTHDVTTDRKVNWPMRFGRPDWSKLAQLEKKSLRVKLKEEKDFLKQRSRVAYLSLYY